MKNRQRVHDHIVARAAEQIEPEPSRAVPRPAVGSREMQSATVMATPEPFLDTFPE